MTTRHSSFDPSDTFPSSAHLVVVGGGGAGLAAALAAAENGCTSIVVLEKTSMVGGNTSHADGMFAVESPVQRAEGVKASRDDMFRLATNGAQWKNDARVVRAYVDKSGDTIRWLGQKGLGFHLFPLYREQSPLVWHMVPGADLIQTLRAGCEQAGVRIVTGARVRKMVAGSDGQIVGVAAMSPGGEQLISARSVIVATGGFGGNRKLMKRFNSLYRDSIYYVGRANNTGDGVLLAEELGAATDNHVTFLIEGPNTRMSAKLKLAEVPPHVPKGVVGAIVHSLGTVAKVRYLVWLNRDGERFMNESATPVDMANAGAILRQKDGVCFTVFDDAIRQMLEDHGIVESSGPGSTGLRVRDLKGQMEELQGKGVCKVADSWDEIADWIGCDRSNVAAEIERYNAACDRGHDPVFLKEKRHLLALRTPPFYAIECQTLLMDTLGGITVNEKMEVVGQKVPVIPGLFAAGSCAGGLHGDSYNYDLPGSALGFAINSGRLAGESAVRYMHLQLGSEASEA